MKAMMNSTASTVTRGKNDYHACYSYYNPNDGDNSKRHHQAQDKHDHHANAPLAHTLNLAFNPKLGLTMLLNMCAASMCPFLLRTGIPCVLYASDCSQGKCAWEKLLPC